MPAYNIAANQRDPGIGESYVRGKALRAESDYRQQRMEMEQQDQSARNESFEMDKQDRVAQQAQAMTADPMMLEFYSRIAGGEDATSALNDYASRQYPALREMMDKDGDGVPDRITPEQARTQLEQLQGANARLPQKPQVGLHKETGTGQILNTATGEVEGEAGEPQAEYKAKESYIGPDGKKYLALIMEDGSVNKTGVLVDNKASDTEFSPPNGNDMTAAESIIDGSEKASVGFDDSGDKDKAVYWVATRLRQHQKSGMSVGKAMQKVEEEFEDALTEESDFFSGSDVKFDPSKEGGLPDGVFTVRGIQMRRDEEGNIVRANN